MLLQGLDQHLLEGGDLLQVSLNVTDVNTAEPERRGHTHQREYMNTVFIFSETGQIRHGAATDMQVCAPRRLKIRLLEEE